MYIITFFIYIMNTIVTRHEKKDMLYEENNYEKIQT